MKVYVINRKLMTRILMTILLLGITVIYTAGIENGMLSVFMNNNRKLPIYSVDVPEKKIAISFDAAWGADKTEDILKILKEHNIKTTFFLVGFWVDNFPEMVKKISDEGHEVANHSAHHPKMSTLSKEQIIKELNSTSEKIEAITGKPTTLLRPPFGDYNNNLIETAQELGYQVIQWDVDSLDYKDYGTQAIVDRVLKKVKNGSIVLFHNNATYTPEALPLILHELQKQGYGIVPISELIYKENYYIDHTGRQILLE
ncbi:MAG: polysaccharide deacetylase family sporulation protein PdaB [Clostridiales bacterium GWB2_37_7]|nr:MAG: polysaccharide deacetylase family sporulation protein PdaB [Clostridiales bacterium GWB2_37_7]